MTNTDTRQTTPISLVAGGDGPTRAMLRFLLEYDGSRVVETAEVGGRVGIHPGLNPALLVLVVGRHEEDVFDCVIQMRRAGLHAPVLLLAHGASLDLRRRAYALGVRDVVNLPIRTQDLRQRLRAALGDQLEPDCPDAELDCVRAGGLTLRVAAREVSHEGHEGHWAVRLTRRETALLKVLMLHPGQAVGHAKLLRSVWGDRDPETTNAIAVLVRRLRAKLAGSGAGRGYVYTEHGHGYAFEARAQPRPPLPAGARPPVLVVDDDDEIATVVAEILQRAGYDVARGMGPDAPVLARQTLPRVILLDINMPGLNGVEISQHLRANPRTAAIPVIAFSAAQNLRSHNLQMAADDYLPKPFDVDELLLRVEKWAGPGAACQLA